jgi:hypothetical protein
MVVAAVAVGALLVVWRLTRIGRGATDDGTPGPLESLRMAAEGRFEVSEALARVHRAIDGLDVERAGMLRAATWYEALGSTPSVAPVMLDAPGLFVLDGIETTEWSVLYRKAEWPAVRSGDRIVIDAATYEVRDQQPVADGLLVRAALRRLA